MRHKVQRSYLRLI